MLNMFQSAYLEQSILFAEKVEGHFAKANRKSRGVKQAGFVVLKETTMPSVLVETGFLSNYAEEAFLMTEEGQAIISGAMIAAFEDYRRHVENSPEAQPLARAQINLPVKISPKKEQPVPKKKQESTPAPLASGRYLVARSPENSAPPTQSPVPEKQRVAMKTSERKAEQVEVQPERSIQPMTPQPEKAPDTRPLPGPASLDDIGISLHVQLAASQKPLDTDHPKWNNTGYLIEVVQEDGYFKYQAKNFTTLQNAYQARTALENRGFPGAFIVAYRNGARISMDEVHRAIGTP
jgi:N-acetylmuramoyl-L-alanine amidase